MVIFLDKSLLTDNYLGMSRPSADKIASFVSTINDVKHTKFKTSFCGGLHHNYQFLWIGGHFPSLPKQIQNYTFTTMIKMEEKGTLLGLCQPWEMHKH